MVDSRGTRPFPCSQNPVPELLSNLVRLPLSSGRREVNGGNADRLAEISFLSLLCYLL